MAAVVLMQTWEETLAGNEAAVQFLNTHGKTLEHRHTGIDADHRGTNGARRFTSEPYGVFSSSFSGNKLFALTLPEMKLLTIVSQAMPSNIVNDPIKNNMAHVLNRAMKDYVTYLGLLHRQEAPRLQKVD